MRDAQIDEYRLDRFLDADGLVESHLAHPIGARAGGPVRLRLIELPSPPSPEALERFEKEVEAARALAHKGLLSPIGSGVHEGMPYLVTELPSGRSVHELVQASGPLSPEQVVRIGLDVAEALEHLHSGATSVVHRGINPRQMLVTDEGAARLDGLAVGSLLHEVGTQLSQVVAASCWYFSPEQVKAAALDAKSDIFSLASTLYEALTGERAFRAPSPLAVTIKISMGKYTSLDETAPHLPEPLRALLHRMLSTDPKARPTAAEVCAELSAMKGKDRGTREELAARVAAIGAAGDTAGGAAGGAFEASLAAEQESTVPMAAEQESTLPAATASEALSAYFASIEEGAPTAPLQLRPPGSLVPAGGGTLGDDLDELDTIEGGTLDPERLAAAQAARRVQVSHAPVVDDEFDARATMDENEKTSLQLDVARARAAIRHPGPELPTAPPTEPSRAPAPIPTQAPSPARRAIPAPPRDDGSFPPWAWIVFAVGGIAVLIAAVAIAIALGG